MAAIPPDDRAGLECPTTAARETRRHRRRHRQKTYAFAASLPHPRQISHCRPNLPSAAIPAADPAVPCHPDRRRIFHLSARRRRRRLEPPETADPNRKCSQSHAHLHHRRIHRRPLRFGHQRASPCTLVLFLVLDCRVMIFHHQRR